MTKPVRLRLSRRKGFSLQAHSRETNGLDAVSVARPSRWGNPFVVGGIKFVIDDHNPPRKIVFLTSSPEEAVATFRWMASQEKHQNNIVGLKGKNLACWCKAGEPCHADVLLEIANREEP